MAAKLAHRRQLSGHRSWEEFFETLIKQADCRPPPSPSTDILEQVETIVAKHAESLRNELGPQLNAVLSHLEALSHTNDTLQVGQERTESFIQRLHDLMIRVFQETEPHDHDESHLPNNIGFDAKTVDEAINKIRRRYD